MRLSEQERSAKLKALATAEGFTSLDELIAATVCDSVAPGICIRTGCEYTTEVEPDQPAGWCEECRANTVASALKLAELI